MEFILSIDQSLFKLINQVWTSPWADVFFPWITDLHKTLTFKLISFPLILLIFIFSFKKQGLIVFLMCLCCLGWTDFFGNTFIKKTIERQRPFHVIELNTIQRTTAHGYSFTSNHATNMFAFATFVSLFIPSLCLPTFILATLVAYSRIYNGVHYPFDVIVGAIVGIFWAFIFYQITKKLLLKSKGYFEKSAQ